MIWMHLFNFLLYIVVIQLEFTDFIPEDFFKYFLQALELYLQLFVSYLVYRFVLNMQHSESTDEVIGKSVPFTTFLRNHRAYKLASLIGDAQVRECIRRTKEEEED